MRKLTLILVISSLMTLLSACGGGTSSPATFTVSGTLTGLSAGASVTLQNNGGDDLTLTADDGFSFATALADGSAYSVTVLTQPASPSQTCTVTSAAGALAGANVSNVAVVCVTNTFTVGGTLTGLAAGTSVTLQNNGGDDLTLTADDSFSFATALADGSGYSVAVLTQPASPSQTCTVTSAAGTLAGTNVSNVAVECVTNTFTVGGTLTGLAGLSAMRVSVTLQNNGGDDLILTADDSFSFATALADGSAYSVTVLTQPPAQMCTVTNAAGTLAGANVTNVAVECVTNNIVFVTSTMQDANLGGLVGADAICNERAAAAALPGNNYVAWLSTSTVDASDRLVTVDATGQLVTARGWVRPDGLPFADTVADITTGKLFYPPRLDEFGIDVGGSAGVFTGTASDGTVQTGFTCTDWTNNATGTLNVKGGYADATTQIWTSFVSSSCSSTWRLYCFGTDNAEPVLPPASTGRFAFVSNAEFPPGPGTGLAAADTLCGNEATAAALPGTYKALLATESFHAASRFILTGSTWVRLDGVAVVTQPSDLTGPQFLAPLNLQADGVTYLGNYGVWMGAADFNTVGIGTSCTSWTSIVGDGDVDTAARSVYSLRTRQCSNPASVRLYCLQE